MNGLLRKTLRLGIAGSIGFGVVRTLRARRGDDQPAWSPPGWAPAKTTAALDAARAQARESVTMARAKVSALQAPSPAPIPPSPAAATVAPAPAPTEAPPAPAPAKPAAASPLWVKAAEGVCPQSHPIKAKLASKIFHSPGGRNYDRTKADRCYAEEAAAVADGLRPPQR